MENEKGGARQALQGEPGVGMADGTRGLKIASASKSAEESEKGPGVVQHGQATAGMKPGPAAFEQVGQPKHWEVAEMAEQRRKRGLQPTTGK